MNTINKATLTTAILTILYGYNPSTIYAAETEESAKELESVAVFGKGETRQVSGINSADIGDSAAGSSPLKVLGKLPGVNFNSADSLGAYEWGSRISMRGFAQNQLGFTLDDVPLGDMSYRNYNGLHISRAITSENLGKVAVSQGTGALGTASNSNLGGTIQFYSLDPSNKRAAKIEQSVGEYTTLRTFARFDSGLIGDSNTKFSVSIADHGQDKWKGPGEQKYTQVNSKVVTNFDHAKLSAFFNWSDRQEADYMDLSKDSIKRLGYKWDYFAPNWDLAKQVGVAAGQSSFTPIDTPNGQITSSDDAYYNGSGMREDKLAGVTLDYSFTNNISLKTTAYHHDQAGTGTWWLPDPPKSAEVGPVALRTLGFDINRNGFLSGLNINEGRHKINTGIWYEHNDFGNSMNFFSQANGPSSAYSAPKFDPYYTRWDYAFQTDTIQLHAQDTVKITDQLTANFGFKSPHTITSIKSNPNTDPNFLLNGELTAEKSFLPQGGINFKIDQNNELFADAAQNIRAYRGVIKGGTSPFDTNQAGFDAIKNKIHPEESLTEELGWRFRHSKLESSVTLYHVDFSNRLLALGQDSAIKGYSSALANVGRVETFGIEGFLAYNIIPSLKFTNSLSLNDSTYKSNFTSGGTTYNIDGKQVIDAPRLIFNSQLLYDDGSAFGHVGNNYIGKRYYTYTNDNSITDYNLVDLGAGYRWKNIGVSDELSVRFNVNNLTDKRYYVLGDNPIPASDAGGTSYNLLAGAPRTFFFTFGAKF